MNKPLPQNLINKRTTANEVIWVSEVANETSQNTIRVYAQSIQQALTLIDNYATHQLSASQVLSIELEAN